jgi:phage shock protein A
MTDKLYEAKLEMMQLRIEEWERKLQKALADKNGGLAESCISLIEIYTENLATLKNEQG